MIIVYERGTGEIIGHCSRVFDSGQWRDATIAELFPNRDISNLASTHFPDDARYLRYGPENWRLRRDESGAVAGIERTAAREHAVGQPDDKNGVKLKPLSLMHG